MDYRGLWVCGVILFPLGALLVPPDVLPIPRIRDGSVGVAVALIWGAGFTLMSIAMVRLSGLKFRQLVAAQLLAGVVFCLAPAMPSIDNYLYLGFGDMLARGENPWRAHQAVVSNDVMRAATIAWGNPPPASRYGPFFVAGEAGLLRMLQRLDLTQLLVVQRLASLLASIAVTLCVRGPNIRFWALNPFVFYYFNLEAHNDVVFLMLLALGARCKWPVISGLFVGAAGMVKIVSLAVPVFRRTKDVAATALGAAVVVAASFVLVPNAFDPSAIVGQARSMGNSPFFVLRSLFVSVHVPHGVAAAAAMVALVIALGAIAACYRWSRRDAPAVAALLFILALPQIWPWYFGWVLAAAIGTARRRTVAAAVGICALAFALEIPEFGLPDMRLPLTGAFLLCLSVIVGRTIFRGSAWRIPPGRLSWWQAAKPVVDRGAIQSRQL